MKTVHKQTIQRKQKKDINFTHRILHIIEVKLKSYYKLQYTDADLQHNYTHHDTAVLHHSVTANAEIDGTATRM